MDSSLLKIWAAAVVLFFIMVLAWGFTWSGLVFHLLFFGIATVAWLRRPGRSSLPLGE